MVLGRIIVVEMAEKGDISDEDQDIDIESDVNKRTDCTDL